MLIAQITDLHISLPGRRAHDLYRTGEHLARWVERLNGLEPAPDLVLATGDLVNDGEAEEYASLAALLAPLRMPVYLIPGNHDDRENLLAGFPGHAYLPRDSEFLHYVVEGHPLRLIGLDTTMAVAESMYEEFEEPLYAPPPLLCRMVEAGLLGRKTGRGFYEYPGH